MMDISFLETLPEQSVLDTEYSVLVDALFGFSFHPPVRESFLPLLVSLSQSRTPLASIDIPSGIIISIFNQGNFLTPPPFHRPIIFLILFYIFHQKTIRNTFFLNISLQLVEKISCLDGTHSLACHLEFLNNYNSFPLLLFKKWRNVV